MRMGEVCCVGRYSFSFNTMKSGRVLRRVLGAILFVGIVELGSAGGVAVANRVLNEPIVRTTSIYEEQTRRIQQLVYEDPDSRRDQLDSILGWVYAAGWNANQDVINSQGIRATRDFPAVPAAGVTRIAVFGNSFTYGTEVSTEEAWSSRVNELSTDLEILNYGVGGYGTDQSLLRFMRAGAALCSEAVIMGFAPVNLRRTVNVYRRFVSVGEQPRTKPRFRLADDQLELIDSPIRTISDWMRLIEDPKAIQSVGVNDYWYEPLVYENPFYDWSATVRLGSHLWIRIRRRYIGENRLVRGGVFNVASEAFEIQLALLRRFVELADKAGVEPALLVLPDRESLVALLEGRPSIYQPLVDSLLGSQVTVLDASQAFSSVTSANDLARLFMPGGHYSPSGNELVAKWLVQVLPLRLLPSVATRHCNSDPTPK